MRRRDDDATPHALVGRAGLVFAYVCFLLAIGMFGGALYFLPLSFKAKLFLASAVALLTSMFAFMAVATHLVLRQEPSAKRNAKAQGEVEPALLGDAKGSLRSR